MISKKLKTFNNKLRVNFEKNLEIFQKFWLLRQTFYFIEICYKSSNHSSKICYKELGENVETSQKYGLASDFFSLNFFENLEKIQKFGFASHFLFC